MGRLQWGLGHTALVRPSMHAPTHARMHETQNAWPQPSTRTASPAVERTGVLKQMVQNPAPALSFESAPTGPSGGPPDPVAPLAELSIPSTAKV